MLSSLAHQPHSVGSGGAQRHRWTPSELPWPVQGLRHFRRGYGGPNGGAPLACPGERRGWDVGGSRPLPTALWGHGGILAREAGKNPSINLWHISVRPMYFAGDRGCGAERMAKFLMRTVRGFLLALIGALSLMVGLPAMAATPAGLVGVLPAPISESLPAATHTWCRKGEHWVRGGHAKDGTYRAGHCAPK
jgi:hypothetical protein